METEKKKWKPRWDFALILILLLEVAVFGGINPRFLKPMVLFGSINDFISIAIIGLFVTFVLISGGMDIQSGSIVGLSSIFIGLMWQNMGMNIWVASLLAVFMGAVCGAISGFFVAFANVQPMVVTLGGSFLYSGLAVTLTSLSGTESYKGISGFPTSFTAFTKYRFFGIIPVQLLIFLVLAVIAYILLHRSIYGRKVFLCGVNPNAADYSGIGRKLIVMSTYMLSGMSASIAGIILTSYLGTAKADFGKELTLPIITAVVLGGTANTGGVGSIVGTALAALVIGILRFGHSMAGMNTQYLDIPQGIVLILAVAGRICFSNPEVKKFFSKKSSKAA